MQDESNDSLATSQASEALANDTTVSSEGEIAVELPRLSKQQMIQARRNRGKAFYKLSVDLAQSTKRMMAAVIDDKLESTLGAYMQLMKPPTDPEQKTIEVDVEVLQQLGLFSATFLSRQLAERYRS